MKPTPSDRSQEGKGGHHVKPRQSGLDTGRTLCPRAAGRQYLSRWLSRCTGSRDFSKNGSGWASESGETEPC